MSKYQAEIEEFMNRVKKKSAHETEFLQAVEEVVKVIIPFIANKPKYKNAKILERMVIPERVISFRVPWLDDNGEVQVNTGYRIGFNSAIGPYKGGLRFDPSVNLSILKFLGFEQVFKNSLTTLPMGGGKGGADFNPRGKSDNEVMKFCQSYMSELFRHIGPNTDIPAGDIGVGVREIGYLFGQYKRLKNEFTGVLTGKSLNWGGSLIRPEATGYGVVYFAEQMLAAHNKGSIAGKTVTVSGFGNVAWGVVKKVAQLGGKAVTVSGPDGYIYDKKGITGEKIDYLLEMRASGRNRVQDYSDKYPEAEFFKGKKPWEVKCDIAIPAATQNELNIKDAKSLVSNGCICVTEAANMPSTFEAIEHFEKNKMLFSPGKASNAGGVATSGLEMSQNSQRLNWSGKEVDEKLQIIMKGIHNVCKKYGTEENGYINYIKGANIAGFVKVADAMIEQGVV